MENETTITEGLQNIQPPPNIEQNILAWWKLAPIRHWPQKAQRLALASTSLFLLSVISFIFSPPKRNHIQTFRSELSHYLSHQLTTLALYTDDLVEISEFLRVQESHGDLTLPPGLHGLPSHGCTGLFWQGQKVSLICFQEEDQTSLHLFIADRNLFTEIPETPQFAMAGDWHTATWGRADKAYLLAGNGDLGRRF